MRASRHYRSRQKRSKFIRVDMQIRFTLTLKKQELDQLITRAVKEGIGDWAIIDAATKVTGKGTYTVPFHVIDLETNQEYVVTRSKILRGIRDALIDFPYALDTQAGYNLAVENLIQEDIDEIIQLAIFKRIQYKFI